MFTRFAVPKKCYLILAFTFIGLFLMPIIDIMHVIQVFIEMLSCSVPCLMRKKKKEKKEFFFEFTLIGLDNF